jgi:hypothetical protein
MAKAVHGGYLPPFLPSLPSSSELALMVCSSAWFSSAALPAAQLAVLAGYIFDISARNGLAFWRCTLMNALALVLLLLLKPIKREGKKKTKE